MMAERKWAGICCGILALMVCCYSLAVLLTYDPAAASTEDLIGSTVLNAVLVVGFLLSARFVWQGRRYWVPISLIVYMLFTAGLGAALFVGLGWAYHASNYVIGIQVCLVVVGVLTLAILLHARLARPIYPLQQ